MLDDHIVVEYDMKWEASLEEFRSDGPLVVGGNKQTVSSNRPE